VHEIESISTLPMALPPIHDSEAGYGDAQARRRSRGVSECGGHSTGCAFFEVMEFVCEADCSWVSGRLLESGYSPDLWTGE
ncbi:hypothetical protein, partial [Paraburkholderia sp. NMBU_R16]|uniref:hypothetical protein n=1 Tax=Paraburkholderia sp. NMBU_R16 TaxID=2698676 RepID=UPI001C26B5BF